MSTAHLADVARQAFLLGVDAMAHVHGLGDQVNEARLSRLVREVAEGRLTFNVSPGELDEDERPAYEHIMPAELKAERESARLVLEGLTRLRQSWDEAAE